MSTRPLTWKRAGAQAWLLTYSGTGPYRHILEGKEVCTTSEEQRYYDDAAYTLAPPAIEVLDTSAGDVSMGETYPPFAVIRWRGRTTASYYKVKRYNGATYDTVDHIAESGQGYYRWEDTTVDIPTTRLYQITTVDTEGNESGALGITVLIVGIPGRPTQTYSYSAGTGNMTITVAAPT